MQGFGGLDNCSLCGVEVEEGGTRMRGMDDITYVFCARCSSMRKGEISRKLGLED